MNIEEKRILKTLTYYYGAGFADFPQFFDAIDEFGDFNAKIKKDDWKYQIYKRELKRLKEIEVSTSLKETLVYFKKEGYKENYNKIISFLSKIFPIENWPKLHLIDGKLPLSGNDSWESMSVDAEDETFFCIDRGIYYQSKYLTHGYYEFIIAHELIHWIISQYSEEYFPFVSLYEEGMCDFFAAMALKEANILPIRAIKNIYLYNRHFKPIGSLWKNYHLFLNKVIFLGLEYGLSNLIDIIKGGRKSVQNVEGMLKRNKSTEQWDNSNLDTEIMFELLDVNSYLSMEISEYIIMSQLAEEEEEFVDFQKIRTQSSIPPQLFIETVQKLNATGFLFVKDSKLFHPNSGICDRIRYKNE